MTKAEKIKSLETAMTVSKRPDETEFTHFTDTAPKELVDLFLEHYEVRDLDHDTFSRACDIVAEVYEGDHSDTEDEALERIYEKAPESASIWNDDRIGYITVWNEDEIAETVRGMQVGICEAAAIWYDRQVEQAAILINEWLNA